VLVFHYTEFVTLISLKCGAIYFMSKTDNGHEMAQVNRCAYCSQTKSQSYLHVFMNWGSEGTNPGQQNLWNRNNQIPSFAGAWKAWRLTRSQKNELTKAQNGGAPSRLHLERCKISHLTYLQKDSHGEDVHEHEYFLQETLSNNFIK